MNHCRKLVGMLGCVSSADVHVLGPSTRTLTSSSHADRGSSSRAASSSHIVEEDEEDEEEYEEQAEGEEEGVARRSTMRMTDLHPLSQPRKKGETAKEAMEESILVSEGPYFSSHNNNNARDSFEEEWGAHRQEGGDQVIELFALCWALNENLLAMLNLFAMLDM